MKWRSKTSVVCDRRINERLKFKICRGISRPVALYGLEWASACGIKRYIEIAFKRCSDCDKCKVVALLLVRSIINKFIAVLNCSKGKYSHPR